MQGTADGWGHGSSKAGLGSRCGLGSGGSSRRGSGEAGLDGRGWLRQEKAVACAGSGRRAARTRGLKGQRSRGSRGA